MSSYTVAIVGTGRVGAQFDFAPEHPDNHADAIAISDSFTLVAGVNRGREKLDLFGERYGIDALYQDYRQMLDEVGPDVCIVATHPELHREMVEGCAAASTTKAIICEKPMALSLEECDAMIDACKCGGVLLQINHNRRWEGHWVRVKELLDEGAIGDLNHIYCYMDGGKPAPWWRAENEGPLLHDFTHFFDLMDMLAGDVDWLCGMAEQRSRPWAVEDFSAAFMKFKSGALKSLVSRGESAGGRHSLDHSKAQAPRAGVCGPVQGREHCRRLRQLSALLGRGLRGARRPDSGRAPDRARHGMRYG